MLAQFNVSNAFFLTLRPATVFFLRFPATGGGVIDPHTVKMILYAIGDRYRLAVKIYSAETIDGINQYSIFTTKFQSC